MNQTWLNVLGKTAVSTLSRKAKKAVAKEVAKKATVGVTGAAGLTAIFPDEVEAVAKAVTEQDPWWKSMRLAAAVSALLAFTLGLFGAEIGATEAQDVVYNIMIVLSIILPALSKGKDIRPTKQ